MKENISYQNYLKLKKHEFESICTKCGECCGSKDDPCANLVQSGEGRYHCKVYENRLGPQVTVSGNSFRCVSIREHIAKRTLRPNCAYRVFL